MTNLTETSYIARKTIKYGSVFLLIFVIFYSVAVNAYKAYKTAHQKIVPDVRYGRLPAIIFPQKQFEVKNFSLELAKDTMPTVSPAAKVFVVYRPVSTLLALEEDTQTARKLGFLNKPTEIRTGVYQFTRTDSDQTLVMNVLEGSFSVSYPYKNDQLLITSKNLPEKDQAIQLAQTFLSTIDKMTPDLVAGNQNISYWSISSQGLKKVSSYSEANAVRVDFVRQEIDDSYKVVYSDPDSSSISILLSASSVESKRIIDVNYKYAPIDATSFSYYPIISPQSAFDALKKGKYWPARDSTSKDIAIKNMYLAYYEPSSLTNFMLPVYVFEGSQNFVAYVTAVDPGYISQE